jgi:hypothetical protein
VVAAQKQIDKHVSPALIKIPMLVLTSCSFREDIDAAEHGKHPIGGQQRADATHPVRLGTYRHPARRCRLLPATFGSLGVDADDAAADRGGERAVAGPTAAVAQHWADDVVNLLVSKVRGQPLQRCETIQIYETRPERADGQRHTTHRGDREGQLSLTDRWRKPEFRGEFITGEFVVRLVTLLTAVQFRRSVLRELCPDQQPDGFPPGDLLADLDVQPQTFIRI